MYGFINYFGLPHNNQVPLHVHTTMLEDVEGPKKGLISEVLTQSGKTKLKSPSLALGCSVTL